jgi:hypothetical protein
LNKFYPKTWPLFRGFADWLWLLAERFEAPFNEQWGWER